jgi:hypothetical protein
MLVMFGLAAAKSKLDALTSLFESRFTDGTCHFSWFGCCSFHHCFAVSAVDEILAFQMDANKRQHFGDVFDAVLCGHFSVANLRDFTDGFAHDCG